MAKPKTAPARRVKAKKPPAPKVVDEKPEIGDEDEGPPPDRKTRAKSKLLADHIGVELKPLMKGKEVQRLLKPMPGYTNLLDDVAKMLPVDAAALNLKEIKPKQLLDLKVKLDELAPKEAAARAVYLSIRQQRMVLDDEGMRYLRAINRRVNTRQEEDPDLYERWKPLRDYLLAFRAGPGEDAGAGGGTDEQ